MKKKHPNATPATAPLNNVIDATEAASLLGVTPDHVLWLCRMARIPAKRLRAGWVLWKPDLQGVELPGRGHAAEATEG